MTHYPISNRRWHGVQWRGSLRNNEPFSPTHLVGTRANPVSKGQATQSATVVDLTLGPPSVSLHATMGFVENRSSTDFARRRRAPSVTDQADRIGSSWKFSLLGFMIGLAQPRTVIADPGLEVSKLIEELHPFSRASTALSISAARSHASALGGTQSRSHCPCLRLRCCCSPARSA